MRVGGLLQRFADGVDVQVDTALAWLAGLAVVTGFTTPLWQPGQPLPLTVVIGVAGGLLMAATFSAVSGIALRRMLP